MKTDIKTTDISAMQPFERLLVLGCGGSGKSTLSAELGKVTGNPTTGSSDLVLWLLVPMMISGAALMFLIWNKKRQSV